MFNTRFNPANRLNSDKIYDRHDKVDRLSYLDTNKLIKRFMQSGEDLRRFRILQNRTAMYDDDTIPSDDVAPAVSPYAMDRVDADNAISALKDIQDVRKAEFSAQLRAASVAQQAQQSATPADAHTVQQPPAAGVSA